VCSHVLSYTCAFRLAACPSPHLYTARLSCDITWQCDPVEIALSINRPAYPSKQQIMLDVYLLAEFEPSEATLLKETSSLQLLAENPLLASALFNLFPYLLLVDNFLEVVTWTNDDHYQNFLLMVVYSTMVMYWHVCSHLVLPILFSMLFSMIVWSILLVIDDSKYNEKPTIDEVLHSLHNITIRFELLLRPIKHVHFTRRKYWTLLMTMVMLTPVHVLIVTYILSPQIVLWLAGLFVLSYHSPTSFLVRRLVWRSVYVRIVAFYITGLDIKLDRRNQNHHLPVSRIHSPSASGAEEDDKSHSQIQKLQLLSDFKIVRKMVTSPTQLKQIVEFEILENERRWVGFGWAKFLLPSERPNFCYQQLMMTAPHVPSDANEDKDSFPFPVFENDLYLYLWAWSDENWILDLEFNKGKDKDGWCYYDNNWLNPSYVDGMTKYTRSRKWNRKAVLIIDKRAEVNDN
jgi:hypothetical protein